MAGRVAGPARGPRFWVVGAVALVLAWLVARVAVAGALAQDAPGAALALWPNNPPALIARSGYVGGSPSPTQSALLDRAARTDPLYPQPYLAAAARAAATGDHVRAVRLGEAARARDPRSLPTHLLLLEEYARVGDIRAVVAEMAPFATLAGGTAPALGQALDAVAQTPRGAEVIAAALRTNPSWRGAFLAQARGAGERLAFRTLARPPAGASSYDQAQDRSSFLQRLVSAGDYERAYLAWVNFLPPGAAAQVSAIYDGSFRGLPGVAPFGWTLAGSEAATAEPRTDSSLPGRTALDVNFFGNDAATVATQTLFVQPGPYLFTMIGAADAGGAFPGRLSWRLQCLPSGQVIPLATMGQFTGRPFAVRRPVDLPAAGCRAQQLSLTGDPGEVSTLVHAQFTGLALTAR